MPTPTSEVRALAFSVTSRYGLHKCLECVVELHRVMVAAGKKATILQLSTRSGEDCIVMKDPDFKFPFPMRRGDDAISLTGKHYGVLVGGFVFDNIHKEGIARARWEGSFDCLGHAFIPTKPSPSSLTSR